MGYCNVVASGAQTVRNCKIAESEGGVLVNTETKEPFSYKDTCVEQNPHVGGNPATAQEARKAGVAVTPIGAIIAGSAIPSFLDERGRELVLKRRSFSHF